MTPQQALPGGSVSGAAQGVGGASGPVARDMAALEPLKTVKSRWPAIIGGVLTLAMIVGLGQELLGRGLVGLSHSVPTNPLFYIVFVGLYMALPIGDYIIFRRLWGIPISGMAALIRKRIANEVAFSYSGEAYFYAWARANAKMVAAPFGAVKDVGILSAIAGNAITLLMIGLALPVGRELLTPEQLRLVWGSIAIVMATSLPFLIFSRRVFSLDRKTLWWVFMVHCTRLIANSLLVALAWHYGMPSVSLGMWLFLSAARLLVSRLPLVPNKDLLFANFAILLIGQDQELSELIAFTAALTLLVHVVLIAGFGVAALVRKVRA
ncbi:hypothetical protein [Sphingomonas sp. Leaf257]|jgi:hypothetical protein|uniref:hypothetical protein n=1 Tax=Sphingomonas sp. Leaf257 TaxID=1736309 RepID=UPI000B10236A|nr:hypothetical protein [Sphingomonas sp. Leaf257]